MNGKTAEDFLRLYWRRRVWVLLCLLQVLLLAYGYTATRPDTYSTSATILVGSDFSVVGGVNIGERRTKNEAQVISSAVVASRVYQKLANPAPILATPAKETDTVTISTTTSSGQRAFDTVQTYVNEYLAFRASNSAKVKEDALKRIDLSIELTSRQLADTRRDIAAISDPTQRQSEILTLQTTEASLVSVLSGLRTDRDRTESGALGSDAVVLSPPYVPGPNPINLVVNLFVGAVIGLSIGAIVASIVDSFDRRVHSLSSVEEASGLDTTAEVSIRSRRSFWSRKNSELKIREGHRRLRIAIEKSVGPGLGHVVQFSPAWRLGSISGEAIGFARQLINEGKTVLLVDATDRGLGIHQQLGVDAGPGLSDLLTTEPHADVVQESKYPGLSVITSGINRTPDSLEMLSHKVLEPFRLSFDWVLVVTQSAIESVNALVSAGSVDLLVAVVRLDQASTLDIRDSIDQFIAAGTKEVRVLVSRA